MEMTLEEKILKLIAEHKGEQVKEAKVIPLQIKKSKAQLEKEAEEYWKKKIINHYAKQR